MKFQVNRDVFSEAVSFAVKLLPQRTTLPILSGVLIQANDGGLVLSSFDYEVSSQTEIQADVEETGTVLVSGRLLAEIAGRLPNAPVRVATEESRISVSCGSASFTLLSMPVEEYPSIPEIGEQSGVVPAEEFSAAVAQVAVAASRDDVTPVITGVQLEVRENSLGLVATDRYRVAVREIEWDAGTVAGDSEAVTALVPARTLQEVGKTFGHSGTISVAITSRDDRELIAFSADKKTVTSLLIKGNFPPVRRLFPETVDNYAVMNTADLIEATRRVSLVLEREAALRYTFTQTGSPSRRSAASRRRLPRRSTRSSPATTPSSRSSRSSCSTGSARCTPSSCASRSPRPRTPTSRVPCSSRASRRATSPAPTATSTCCSRTCCCADRHPRATAIRIGRERRSRVSGPAFDRRSPSGCPVPAVGGRG